MNKLSIEKLTEYRDDIINHLAELPLRDKLDIIANVFMYEGVSLMLDQQELTEEQLKHKSAIELVLDHKRENGETLGSALVAQGVTIQAWLDTE